jgi:hypothetical protein
MAIFTMRLRDVLETHAIKTERNGDIGLNDYPIFQEAHRTVLNQKIIDRYFMREIGQESVELWTFAMRRKMHEIMPPYNQLYAATISADDALKTIDLRTLTTTQGTVEGDTNGTAESTSGGNGTSRSVQSDTPQTLLSENEDYASGAADVTSSQSSTATNTEAGSSLTTESGESESTVTGYQGSLSDLLLRYRATILNIDMMIVEDMSELFIGIYDNGDEYLPPGYNPSYSYLLRGINF